MGKLFDELKRRKVFKVGAVYAVAAWVLIQIADTVLPALQMPEWTVSFVTVLFFLGFPIAIILAWAYEVTPEGIKSDSSKQPASVDTASSDHKLIYATFALVLLVAGFQITDLFLETGIQSTNIQSTIPTPSVMHAEITVDEPLVRRFTGVRTQLAISPDGSQLVYGDLPVGGEFRIMHRNLVTSETRVLTERATLGTIPEFSPDGQRVLLNAAPRALVAPITGGLPQFVDLENLAGGSGRLGGWVSNDEFLYVRESAIYKKSLASGVEEELIPPLSTVSPRNPHLLPNGEAFLYSTSSYNIASANESDIQVFDLEARSTKTIISGGYLARYAPSGHIVFFRNGDLWAVPFDAETLETTGTQVRVIEGIDSQPLAAIASYTFSASGRLVYLPGPEFDNTVRQFSWFDRFGNEEPVPLPDGNYSNPAISPDGDLIAFTIIQNDTSRDIWFYDVARENLSKRTFFGDASDAKWSPDGSQLAFRRDSGIWLFNTDGTGQPELLFESELVLPVTFSKDDGALIYLEGVSGANNIYRLAYQDSTWIPSLVLDTPFNLRMASVSPDGRWIAYVSTESGRPEVFVSPYPDTSRGKWQISTESGREPYWGPNSDELFYLHDLEGDLMSAKITAGSGSSEESPILSADTPIFLGHRFFINFFNPPNYVVSPEGQRFLGSKRQDDDELTGANPEPATLTVVENWFEELMRLAPPDQN